MLFTSVGELPFNWKSLNQDFITATAAWKVQLVSEWEFGCMCT